MLGEMDLQQIERDVVRDYLQDGLADIMIGAFFLLVGLLLPAGSIAFVIVFWILFFAPLLQALKKRYAYPRTCYVVLRQGDPQPLPWFVLGSCALGLLAMGITLVAVGAIGDPAQWYRWMPIFFGIWLAGTFVGLGLRVRLVRYYVDAATALTFGPLFALLPAAAKLGSIGRFFAALGGVLLVWGVATFVRFLVRYPLQDGAVDASE